MHVRLRIPPAAARLHREHRGYDQKAYARGAVCDRLAPSAPRDRERGRGPSISQSRRYRQPASVAVSLCNGPGDRTESARALHAAREAVIALLARAGCVPPQRSMVVDGSPAFPCTFCLPAAVEHPASPPLYLDRALSHRDRFHHMTPSRGLLGRFHDDGGLTASEQSFMDDCNGRAPSTLPRYQRGDRTGRTATTGGVA
jgi:hypothetical protein